MSSDPAISLTNVSKCFQIYDRPRDRLVQMLTRGRKGACREFWALKNVSFEIAKGETVGILGRNGSGKSTLLQIICGTMNPTGGEIKVNGRVAALLELGSGFSPEFTGRENVRLYASLLGLSDREIDERFDSIADFAGINEFIEQPIKTYSSGMVVRLAFAVVAHVDADVLVVDEALSVGDVFFQQKCMRFLRDFQKGGGTIIFVSHDTAAVIGLCERAILLYDDRERAPLIGAAEHVCKRYLEELYSDPGRGKIVSILGEETQNDCLRSPSVHYSKDKEIGTIYSVSGFNASSESFGAGKARITDAGFYDETGTRVNTLNGGELVHFRIEVESTDRIAFPAFGFMLKNSLGEYMYTEGTDLFFRSHQITLDRGDRTTATFVMRMPHLACGQYSMNVAFAEGIGHDHVQHHWVHDAIQLEVTSSRVVHGYAAMNDLDMFIEVRRQGVV